MRLALIVAFVCALASGVSPVAMTNAAPACHATSQTSLVTPGRVDTLQTAGTIGSVLALVGQPGSRLRFLPRDTLEVLRAGQAAAPAHGVNIPRYLMAPGLASRPDGGRFYLLADNRLLALDGESGALLATQALSLQAIGWPAAIAADDTAVYLIGQPSNAWTAQAYAFVAAGNGALRLRWHVPLGLTHAGSWIGLAGGEQLAIYLPDEHDAHGTIELVDRASGHQRQSYDVAGPPVAADASANRLYLAEGGTIHALALHSGTLAATAPGSPPLAVAPTLGLAAYARSGRLIISDASNLRTLLELTPRAMLVPTALAWQGSRLLVGTMRGVIIIEVSGCSGRTAG
jgi:hypothetical protein